MPSYIATRSFQPNVYFPNDNVFQTDCTGLITISIRVTDNDGEDEISPVTGNRKYSFKFWTNRKTNIL
jgi:hypothetical protein